MRKIGGKKGFTLVELSLAVGFIGLLSLTITLIINDTVATYRRGLTLNQVNTTGMDLVDDVRSAIQNSPARDPSYECEALYEGSATVEGSQAWRCAQDHATALIHLERVGRVVIDGVEHDDVPVYGVICTGAYSYIWNSGYFFGENDGQPRANETEDGSKAITTMHQAEFTANEQTISGFRLLKVKDDKRGVCKNAIWNSRASGQTNGGDGVRSSQYYNSDGYDGSLSYRFGTAGQAAGGTGYVDYFASFDPDSQSEVLLDNSATNPLALYDFTISNPVVNSDGEASFYSVSFILGTLTGGINIKSVGNFCKTPEDFEQDFDYCAINKFNFAAQATGG